jgi:SAM-dependent methyltransferase
VIHHLDERVAPLRELWRVLRPGGRLVLSTHHPMADWLRHAGNYFEPELIEEVWRGDWDIRYWRQPLGGSCAEFREAGFLIEQIVEPRPLPVMEELFPDSYRRLTRQPGFIMFSLLRPR